MTILDALPQPQEPLDAAFRRKETELRLVFAQLAVDDAIRLRDRLEAARESDVLATSFGRLAAERRHRLVSFLADARRRSAVPQRKQ